MGRPSHIAVGMEVSVGKLSNVRIGGSAVRVGAGKVRVK